MNNREEFIPQLTADGSFTFFSNEFGEAFHSRWGAREESLIKFVRTAHIQDKARQPTLRLLDVCYGLGYNTAAALENIWQINPNCRVELVGLELYSDVPKAAIDCGLLNIWNPNIIQILTALATSHQVKTDRLQATLIVGDARTTIGQVVEDGVLADAIFLDPFSPTKCPQLWTVEFLDKVAKCLKPDGRLATYSCAAAIRTALRAVGLNIASSAPVGRRSPGTVASFLAEDLPPLSKQEEEHLQTKAAIPYRDRNLCDSAAGILLRRQIEQQASNLEPTSHWRKRWLRST